jgi:glucokinase
VDCILLADIGGTNSRFAVAGAYGRPEQIVIIENNSVANLEMAIETYLAQTGLRPRAAVLAVAAPTDGGEEVVLTNRRWRFRCSELALRFGFSSLRVLNDFEAIAWALLRLSAGDARPLGKSLSPCDGVKVVLGPHFHVVASEGGHASFGPQTPDESEIFARLAAAHGRVSAETILSGPGLLRLLRAIDPQTACETPEAVAAAALAREASAQAAARLFVRLLGRFAGGLALTFKAIGGVYVAGGVASRLGPLLDEELFRTAFEAHPPYERLLSTIPTLLMNRTEPGLLGCAALAGEMI